VLVFLLVGGSAGFGLVNLAKKLRQIEPVQAQVSQIIASPSSPNLERIFVVNIPSFFRELVTMAALEVEGKSIVGGEVSFEKDVVFDGQQETERDEGPAGVSSRRRGCERQE
jgi:hypothetical protein